MCVIEQKKKKKIALASMPTKNKYIMDDPREAGRLASKINTTDWINQHFGKISGAGNTILEVGCGPGTLLNAIKKHSPKCNVVGIDISFERLNYNKASDFIHVVQSDSLTLPFPEQTFDSIYTRFLLEYLADSDKTVSEIYRVCKPGGIIMLQDLDAQLVTNWPIANKLASTIDKIIGALAKTGFDPFIGRKLFSMARAIELENITVTVEPYHLITGSISSEDRLNWKMKLDIAIPVIAKVLGNEKNAELFVRQYLEYLDDPDTFSYSNLITVVGTKPLVNRK